MRKWICLCLALLLLVGCQSSPKYSLKKKQRIIRASMDSFDDTYYNIVKFEDSQLREDFMSIMVQHQILLRLVEVYRFFHHSIFQHQIII